MNNTKNIKLVCCILGSFMLTLLQSPSFFTATYTMFGGGSGENAFTEMLYRLFGVISFVGVILVIIFSCILIISNINLRNK
jgi:multisubunit Na+/H+ antiporter MnhB subunit